MQIRLAQLAAVVDLAQSLRLRSAGASISNARIFHAIRVFEKGVLHGVSICALLEKSRVERELDGAGICALTRTLIETHNVLLYLTEAGISKEELELRLFLMYLNQVMDLIRMGDALELTKNENNGSFEIGQRDFAVRELEGNQAFLALDEKHRKHLLKSGTPFLMDRYKGPRPASRKIESAAYNLFSHNVHTFGLAGKMGGSATPAGFMNVLILAVEMAVIYLSHMIKRYQAVRTRAVGKLAPSERGLIDDALSLNYFNAWVEKLKRERVF